MGPTQIKEEGNHTYIHTNTRINSLAHDWFRQCICDTRPMAFPVFCLRPFSNIHITLSAQASVYLCVCVFECASSEDVWECDLGLLQTDCLDTAFSCLTELSGMLLYEKKSPASMHERTRVLYLYSPSDTAAIPPTATTPPTPQLYTLPLFVSHKLQHMCTGM